MHDFSPYFFYIGELMLVAFPAANLIGYGQKKRRSPMVFKYRVTPSL